MLSNGNADNLTVNGKLDFKYEEAQWLYNVYALALRTESSDVNTANRYEIGDKAGYKFNERAYMLGSARHENDDFAPYEYQTTGSNEPLIAEFNVYFPFALVIELNVT